MPGPHRILYMKVTGREIARFFEPVELREVRHHAERYRHHLTEKGKGPRPMNGPGPRDLSVLVALGSPAFGCSRLRHGALRSLRGRHLHRTETKAVQWITSFVGRLTA